MPVEYIKEEHIIPLIFVVNSSSNIRGSESDINKMMHDILVELRSVEEQQKLKLLVSIIKTTDSKDFFMHNFIKVEDAYWPDIHDEGEGNTSDALELMSHLLDKIPSIFARTPYVGCPILVFLLSKNDMECFKTLNVNNKENDDFYKQSTKILFPLEKEEFNCDTNFVDKENVFKLNDYRNLSTIINYKELIIARNGRMSNKYYVGIPSNKNILLNNCYEVKRCQLYPCNAERAQDTILQIETYNNLVRVYNVSHESLYVKFIISPSRRRELVYKMGESFSLSQNAEGWSAAKIRIKFIPQKE